MPVSSHMALSLFCRRFPCGRLRREAPAIAAAAVAAFLIAGCGGANDAPPTVPVKGTITHNDQPLTGGKLLFTPTGTTKGKPGSADIGADGTFVVSGGGLAKGEYAVSVESVSGDISDKPPEGVKMTVPAKYSNSATTDLNVTITGPEEETVKLELKD